MINHAAVSTVLSFALSAGADQVSYTVTDLGSLGSFHSLAASINESGLVVGSANTPASGYELAVVFAGEGTVFPLTGEAVSGAFASGVNDHGVIVGMTDSFGLHGFVFDGGLLIDLGTPMGGWVSEACGVNNAGIVVGSASDLHGFTKAVRWDKVDGVYVPSALPALGPMASAARAVNTSGVIVGMCDQPPLVGVPCIWDNAGVRSLGVETSSYGEALAINDAGRVVGYSFTQRGTMAFVWDQQSGTTDLGNLGGFHASAQAINNSGEVVGQSYIGGTSAAQHAFVWRNGVMTDLNTVTVNGAGWTLWNATDIADDGRIVGGGVLNGQPHAFLLTPIATACAADVGGPGGTAGADGLLNNNDFIAFIDMYFSRSSAADIGGAGGTAGPDGAWDNNDFIVFITRFFAGC